jgi:hypothetical protein
MNDLSRRLLLTRMGVAGAALASSPFVLSAKNRATPKRTMTELRQALRGVHNFMVTPFRSNYDLDAEGLRKNVAYHAAGNTENMTIVVGGGLGELFTLDPRSRKVWLPRRSPEPRGKCPSSSEPEAVTSWPCVWPAMPKMLERMLFFFSLRPMDPTTPTE